MGAVPQCRNNDALVAAQQIQCYELRLTGMSIRAIAKKTGLSVGTVYKRIQSEIAERVLPLAEEVRKMELDRLDRWLEKLDAQILADKSVARNVEVAVKVAERRAKLLGIDAPEKQDVIVTETTQFDAHFMELVERVEAQNAAKAAEIREGSS